MALQEMIERGAFSVIAEIEPPKGVEVTKMVTNAMQVKEKVDAFLVPEMGNAVMRMSSLGGALVLRAKGLDAVMQVNCRDRNRLALQADLLAGAAGGIESIMLVPGESPAHGDHPDAQPVYDLELDELLSACQGLKNGKDMAGIDLNGAPDFLIGTVVNSGLVEEALYQEIEQMNRRRQAGTGFFVTPPVFDVPTLESFLDRIGEHRGRVIATVLLLKSLDMARYIERNIEHVFIPPPLIQRIQQASDKPRECAAVASELIAQLQATGIAGVLVSTLGWEHRLPAIMGDVRVQNG